METFLLGIFCGAVCLILIEGLFASLRGLKEELDATKDNFIEPGE